MRALLPAAALPYAGTQGAIFLTLGLYLPFWPLWLENQGLSAQQIGLLLALSAWLRILLVPALGRLADRQFGSRVLLILLTVVALLGFAAMAAVQGFMPILLLHLIASVAFFALIPLAETQTMAAVRRDGIDYGRTRLWGSLTFILASAGGGWLIARSGPFPVVWLLLAALMLVLTAAAHLPRREAAALRQRLPVTVLLADRGFLLFLIAAALLQASHALLYGFGSLHWRDAGLSGTTIGWLWAVGVLAEVVLLAGSARLLARLGPRGLLFLAAVGGLLRWSLIASTTEPLVLFGAQILHALTFAAAHVGAIHFIHARAPAGLAATAQAVYAAVTGGLAMGGMMLLAGWLYTTQGGLGFWWMAAVSFVGGMLVIALPRQARDKSR